MEYNVMAGFLGSFYVRGMDENDSASMSPFNTIYPKECPLMQFTGLIDCNGSDIYEGDILLDNTEGEDFDFVEWDAKLGGWTTHQWYGPKELVDNADKHEVVGNIYAHPELVSNS